MEKSGQNASRAAHLSMGRNGEDATASYLKRQGWTILCRNWRPAASQARGHGALELDMVAEEGSGLVFVEVKTRAAFGLPGGNEGIPAWAALTRKKQANLAKAASLYCSAHQAWDRPCRFDLICALAGANGQFSLEHFRNVIEFGQTLGGGNTPWQPW